jgi:type IV pilus assembly protein PilB
LADIGDSISEIIVSEGWVDEQSLESAVEEIGNDFSIEFGEHLIQNKIISEEQLAKALAITSGYEYVKGDGLVGIADATDLVSLEFARTRKVLPIEIKDESMHVVIYNPLDISLTDDLHFMCNMPIVCRVSELTFIEEGISRSYGGDSDDIEGLLEDDEGVEFKTEDEEEENNEDDAVIIKLVDAIIANAVERGASDIHIESMENNVRVRYRIDGKCEVVEEPPKRLQGSMIGRIKLMAKMDIAEKRKPQDGPIKMRINKRSIDLRVSSLPSSFGESIVMRILDKEAVMKGVEELGFHSSDYETFQSLISRPNGIVLVTGPTGSGKTTTLYAALNERNKPNVKLITAEDPVEYNVSGINQIQVNHKIGLNFSSILRAMLRQAPNIILVGEIRDQETAKIAIEASLTGHMVFSTLHTNDAPSSVTRLIDMGIKPYLVSASVIAILAQRLLRKICENCKETYIPEKTKLLSAGISEEMSHGKTFYRGAGCGTCGQTGYKGRIGIYELLKFNNELRQAIFNNASTLELREIALKGGMHTLLMDGVRKFFDGITTIEEVLRVAKAVG